MFRRFSLAVLVFAPLASAAKPVPPVPVRFAVIGDRTGGHVPGIYEQIIQEVERLRPDFAITVGDEIEGYTSDSATLAQQWTEYQSITAGLTMPLYVIPSNHNITTDAQLPAYEHYVGKPLRSFDYGNLHFTIIDASRWESSAELPKEQIAWLVNDLKASKAKYKFVFYHKPFWQASLLEGKPDTLHSIFRNFGVNAVFNGHDHIYFSANHDGILYTAVGSSGGRADPGPSGLLFHFVWVTVDQDGIHIAPIKLGSALPWDEVTAADLLTMDRIYATGAEFVGRVALDDKLAPVDSQVRVKLRNLSDGTRLEDTLRWDAASGWTVEPGKVAVELGPGDSLSLSFKVRHKGPTPYPGPTMSLPFGFAPGKTAQWERSLPLVRTTACYPGAPKIDGDLSDSVWQKPETRLFDPTGGEMKTEPAQFYFAYDTQNLYLGARCAESRMDSLVAQVTDHDAVVYGEDCVGYFIQPNPAKDTSYQIYFNPLGTSFDQRIVMTEAGASADRAWNGTYEVKTIRGKDFWTVEARIPLSQFGIGVRRGRQLEDGARLPSYVLEHLRQIGGLGPWSGRRMGLEFRRKQKRLNCAADWQVPLDYNPATYGVMLLK